MARLSITPAPRFAASLLFAPEGPKEEGGTMSAGAICVRSVQVASPEESVRAVARRMAAAEVGTVVVLGERRKPIGILTDRDVVLRCVAQQRDPDATEVGEVMTAPLTCIHESTSIESALSRMAGTHTRRLAVVDDDERLVGILALDDVLELLAEELTTIGKLVRQRVDSNGPVQRSGG
jgi:CBS domain-containing protein